MVTEVIKRLDVCPHVHLFVWSLIFIYIGIRSCQQGQHFSGETANKWGVITFSDNIIVCAKPLLNFE